MVKIPKNWVYPKIILQSTNYNIRSSFNSVCVIYTLLMGSQDISTEVQVAKNNLFAYENKDLSKEKIRCKNKILK